MADFLGYVFAVSITILACALAAIDLGKAYCLWRDIMGV